MLYYSNIFLLFLIYSVIGYLVEVFCVSSVKKKLTLSRGFLIGPYLPIFGTGAIAMIFFLNNYKDDLIVLFVMGTVLCSVLEYITSLVMEKIFKLRWWDYTDKKFNINGRVCLENGILFGLGGVLIVKIINPIFVGILAFLPDTLVIVLSIILALVFLVDLIITLIIMFRLKINVNKYNEKDSTSEIKKEVREALNKYTYLTTRLIKSFPNIKELNNKNFASFRELLFQTRRKLKELKREYKLNKKKSKIKNSPSKRIDKDKYNN